MKLTVIVHGAEAGGYWAEVPSLRGCATHGEALNDQLTNRYDAVEARLAVDLTKIPKSGTDRAWETAHERP
jgi:predicted RNase H-like HicB family nuclease